MAHKVVRFFRDVKLEKGKEYGFWVDDFRNHVVIKPVIAYDEMGNPIFGEFEFIEAMGDDNGEKTS